MQVLAAALMQIIPLIMSLTVHEYAHAFCAKRLGDSTAERAGRLSLNPVVHIDPVGTLLLPLGMLTLANGAGMHGLPIFGWAKPTPVDTRNMRLPARTAAMLVAGSGPLSNLLLAVLCALALRPLSGQLVYGGAASAMFGLALQLTYLNVGLMVFNLLPVGSLDGHAVLLGLLPARWVPSVGELNQRFGTLALLGIVFFGRDLLVPPIRGIVTTLLHVLGPA